MIERSLTVDGLSIRYIATEQEAAAKEESPPLIILHGWGVSADRWRGVLEYLEQVGISAFAPDLPGFGKSQAPSRGWGLLDYEVFVKHFAETLHVPSFALLGHSFGGRIAITLAWKAPQKITKLILVDAAGVTPRSKPRLTAYRLFTNMAKIIFSLPGLHIFRKPARYAIYWLSGSYDYYLQKGTMKETFQHVIGEDLTPYLGNIKAPTLIIWGKKDRMTPFSDVKIFQSRMPNTRLITFEKLGHSPHVQNPTLVAQHIEQFLRT